MASVTPDCQHTHSPGIGLGCWNHLNGTLLAQPFPQPHSGAPVATKEGPMEVAQPNSRLLHPYLSYPQHSLAVPALLHYSLQLAVPGLWPRSAQWKQAVQLIALEWCGNTTPHKIAACGELPACKHQSLVHSLFAVLQGHGASGHLMLCRE
jgi:hypothetical protein